MFGAWLLIVRHRSLVPAVLGRYSWRYFAFLVASGVAIALFSTTLRKPIADRLFRARRELLLSFLLSIVLVACATEITVRTWDLFGMSMYDEVEKYLQELVPDPVLSFRHPAGLRKIYQGVEVATNEIGLRDRPLRPKSPGVHRILLLGDSVTLGWGVPVEQTYGRRIEVASARSTPQFETVNAGVSGYNTVQEFEFLKSAAPLIKPDIVTLLFVENDVEPVIALPRGTRSLWQGPLFWLARSRAFRFAYIMVPAYFGAQTPPPSDGAAWLASMSALAGIYDYCHARDIPFAAFLYRQRPTPLTDRIWEDISGVASARGFLAQDTAPWFKDVDLLEVVNSRVDVHPNAKGHQILADGITAALRTTPSITH